MSNKNFSSFENLVNLFTSISNKLKNKVEKSLLKDTVGWTGKNLFIRNCTVNNEVIAHVKQGETYTVSCKNSGGKIGFNLKKNDNDGERVAYVDSSTNARPYVTFTANEDFDLFLNGYGVDGTVFSAVVSEIQVEKGDAVTAYEYGHNDVAISKLDISTLKDTVGWDGKNRLHIPDNIVSRTSDGITWTITRNADGEVIEIDMDGTAVGYAELELLTISQLTALSAEDDLIISGSGDDSDTILYTRLSSNNKYLINSRPEVTPVIPKGSSFSTGLRVQVKENKTVSHIKCYPMLRKGNVSSDAFEPHHNTVLDMLSVLDNRMSSDVINVAGITGKNRLPISFSNLKYINYQGTWSGNQYVHEGITYTIKHMNDTVLEINMEGTATADSVLYLLKDRCSTLYAYNGMKLRGCMGGSSATYFHLLYLGISPYTYFAYQTDGDKLISGIPNTEDYIIDRFLVKSGTTLSNEKLYPMIYDDTSYDSEFEPYYLSGIAQFEKRDEWDSRNLLPIPQKVYSNNYSYTLLEDGFIRQAPNNSQGSEWNYANSVYKTHLEAGSYELCIEGKYKPSTSYAAQGYKLFDSNNNVLVDKLGDGYYPNNGTIFRYGFTLANATDVGLMIKLFDGAARFWIQKAECLNKSFTEHKLPLIEAIKTKLNSDVNNFNGAHNLLAIPKSVVSTTMRNVEYTVYRNEADQVEKIHIEGTAPEKDYSQIYLYGSWTSTKSLVPAGTRVKVSMKGAGPGTSMILGYNTTTIGSLGGGDLLELDGGSIAWIVLRVNENITVDNDVYPMITLASDTNDDFTPYAFPNAEITLRLAQFNFTDEMTFLTGTKNTDNTYLFKYNGIAFMRFRATNMTASAYENLIRIPMHGSDKGKTLHPKGHQVFMGKIVGGDYCVCQLVMDYSNDCFYVQCDKALSNSELYCFAVAWACGE